MGKLGSDHPCDGPWLGGQRLLQQDRESRGLTCWALPWSRFPRISTRSENAGLSLGSPAQQLSMMRRLWVHWMLDGCLSTPRTRPQQTQVSCLLPIPHACSACLPPPGLGQAVPPTCRKESCRRRPRGGVRDSVCRPTARLLCLRPPPPLPRCWHAPFPKRAHNLFLVPTHRYGPSVPHGFPRDSHGRSG